MLAAGLKGIEEKYTLPAPVEEDIFEMGPKELKKHKINSMPGSLGEAVEITAKSTVIKEALGDHVFEQFIENKRIEWDQFRLHVSQWELDRYLPIL
jgi:glutamine synthetase